MEETIALTTDAVATMAATNPDFAWGLPLVFLAAALPAALGFVGSAIGMATAGKAASGVLAEKPELFGKLLLMQALSGSQGIYGLVVAFLVLNFSGVLGAETLPLIVVAFLVLNFSGVLGAETLPLISGEVGLQYFFASLPLALSALLSAMMQGKVSAGGILTLAKDETMVGKAMILAAMIETWAIFGVLITFILLTSM